MQRLAWVFFLGFAGCFSDPPADSTGGTSGSSGDGSTSATSTTSGETGTSTTGSGTSTTGGSSVSGDPDTSGTSGCTPGDEDCACRGEGTACEPGLVCGDDLCLPAAHCLVSWGGSDSDDTGTVSVSPITAGGFIGETVATPTDIAFSLDGEALGPDMLVLCGDRFYAAEPDDTSIGLFELEPDLSATFLQHFSVADVGPPGTLRALECIPGANMLLSVTALDTNNEATNTLRASLVSTNPGGMITDMLGSDTSTVTAPTSFESVRTTWSGQLGRGYLVFDSPSVPTMFFRHIDISGTDLSLSNEAFSLMDTPRDRVGGIEVTADGARLAMVGLRNENGIGTAGFLGIDMVNDLDQVFSPLPPDEVPPPVLDSAKALTPIPLEGNPALLGFVGDGVAVLARFDTNPPSAPVQLNVSGTGSGAMRLSDDGALLVVIDETSISTFDALTVLDNPEDEGLSSAPHPIARRAASVLVPCGPN